MVKVIMKNLEVITIAKALLPSFITAHKKEIYTYIFQK